MSEVVIPKTVIEAYLDAASDYITSVHARGDSAVTQNVQKALYESFNRMHRLLEDDVPVLADNSFMDQSSDVMLGASRAELLVGTHNLRLKPALLWTMSLLASDLVKNWSAEQLRMGDTSPVPSLLDALSSFAEASTLAFGAPSLMDVLESHKRIDARSLSVCCMAVRLSCGNEFGLCLSPRFITVGELCEACNNPYLFEGETSDGPQRREGESPAENDPFDEARSMLAPLEEIDTFIGDSQGMAQGELEAVMNKLYECGVFDRRVQDGQCSYRYKF